VLDYEQRHNFEELQESLKRKLNRLYNKQNVLLSQVAELERKENKAISYIVNPPPTHNQEMIYNYSHSPRSTEHAKDKSN
jgi:hypothetical protein